MGSYKEFKGAYLGKSVDIDNFPKEQPFQCADFGNTYIVYIGGKVLYATQTGYVCDYAKMKKTNGLLNWTIEVSLANARQGDIFIWDFGSPDCPYSHIAILDRIENGRYFFLGQNQPYPYVNITTISVAGVIGIFRPKAFEPKDDAKNNYGLRYRGHSQDIGWMDYVHDGMMCGSVGKAKRLEGLYVDTTKVKGELKLDAKVHIANRGWVHYKDIQPNTLLGTTGQKLAIEAIEFDIVKNTTGKKLKYQVHLASYGWTGAVEADNTTGTTGLKVAVEAIRIWLE